MERNAIVLAPPRNEERFITGLTLGERARRVGVKAGIPAHRVQVVRSVAELDALADALAGTPVLFIRATRHIVAPPLVEPLLLNQPGNRKAVDERGAYAGAAVLDDARGLLAALAGDWERGEQSIVADCDPVQVHSRARHPAWTREEQKSADAWQFELIHKPLDGFLPAHYQRPLARPFTRIFLRLPFSPNALSVFSTAVSLTGCFIAAQPAWHLHVIGLAILVFGVILDACDGEVARLRMEESKLGAWLDAIGDDVARIALILAVGLHAAAVYPDWPIAWIMAGTLAATLTSMMLIYWYCIFVIGSSSNQDYEAVLGVGNNVAVDGRKSLGRMMGDLGTTMARRVFIDPMVLILGLLHLQWVSFAGLSLGALIGLAVIIPTHLRIVQSRRATGT